jgi:GrpB-like predicted nucleotidyltransferase (UPF0157 family)
MKIILEPYNTEWPHIFDGYREKILKVLGQDVIDVQHIGSTSILGLASKPIIDIMIGTSDKTDNKIDISKMVNAGFTYIEIEKHNALGRRMYFHYKHPDGLRPPPKLNIADRDLASSGFTTLAHIHSWGYGTYDWQRHIAFRDYLRIHKSERNEYQKLKEELVDQDWESSLHYSRAKNDFIQKMQIKALDWNKTVDVII